MVRWPFYPAGWSPSNRVCSSLNRNNFLIRSKYKGVCKVVVHEWDTTQMVRVYIFRSAEFFVNHNFWCEHFNLSKLLFSEKYGNVRPSIEQNLVHLQWCQISLLCQLIDWFIVGRAHWRTGYALPIFAVELNSSKLSNLRKLWIRYLQKSSFCL